MKPILRWLPLICCLALILIGIPPAANAADLLVNRFEESGCSADSVTVTSGQEGDEVDCDSTSPVVSSGEALHLSVNDQSGIAIVVDGLGDLGDIWLYYDVLFGGDGVGTGGNPDFLRIDDSAQNFTVTMTFFDDTDDLRLRLFDASSSTSCTYSGLVTDDVAGQIKLHLVSDASEIRGQLWFDDVSQTDCVRTTATGRKFDELELRSNSQFAPGYVYFDDIFICDVEACPASGGVWGSGTWGDGTWGDGAW